MSNIDNLIRTVDTYIDREDWRVKENSNSQYSFAGLQGHLASVDLTDYALNTIYTGEISQAHKDHIIHIHDMSHPLVSYCCGYGMELLVKEGFNCGPGYVYSSPAKHLDALFGQLNNFIFTMSGEWAGAQALNSVDTYCAAFIKNDNMTYDEIRRVVRQLIYNLNVKTRAAMQSPFTNFSVDLTVPEDLFYKKAIIGGEEVDFTYGECQEEMNLFNEVLADVMIEGDAVHGVFTFPIITYGITKDFPWGSRLAEKIFTFADIANSPYFSNFINSDIDQTDVRSMCCRLRIDTRELVRSSGGLFGSGDSTGSNGVVTLNLSRIGYMARVLAGLDGPEKLWVRSNVMAPGYEGSGDLIDIEEERIAVRKILEHYPELNARVNIELRKRDEDSMLTIYTMMIQYFMDLGRKSLLIKREVVQESIDRGLVPYTKRYLGHIDNHFNTLGVNAGHELCLNMLDKGIESPEGKALAEYTLDLILNRLSDYQEMDNGKLLWNCLSGDTLVQTTEGNIPIKELVGKTNIDVFCYDEENKSLDIKRAKDIRMTQSNAEVVKVTFSNGQSEVMTPDHPVGVNDSDGLIRYVNAEDLKKGDSILSHYIREGFNGYATSSLLKGGGEFGSRLHTFVHESVTGNKSEVVHHIDGDKMNYSFSNLDPMTDSEHKSMHLKMRHDSGESAIKVGYGKDNHFYGRKHSEESKRLISESRKGKNTGSDNYMTTEEGRRRMSEIASNRLPHEHSQYNSSVSTEEISRMAKSGMTIRQIYESLGISKSLVTSRLKHAGLYRSVINKEYIRTNHEVVSVERLPVREDVYNMEVVDHNNFFIGGDDGVLVHNCEATPAEGAGTRFARGDRKDFKGIITGAGTNMEFYTNSTQLPDYFTDNIYEVFDHQESLQTKYTSGTVQHVYLNEPVYNWKVVESLVKKLFTNYRIPYISISANITICPVCGRLKKTTEYCKGNHTQEQIDELIAKGVISEEDLIEY